MKVTVSEMLKDVDKSFTVIAPAPTSAQPIRINIYNRSNPAQSFS